MIGKVAGVILGVVALLALLANLATTFIDAVLDALNPFTWSTGPASPAGGTNPGNGAPSPGECVPGGPAGTVAGYDSDQLTNTAVIIAVGKQHGISEQGWVVALAAALQESGLRNLPYGDRDSLGLFQQRPSQGWGTPQQIMDPSYAAGQFYRHLQAVPGWDRMPVTAAAQAVQRSATPTAYARHEPAARALATALGAATCAPPDQTARDQAGPAQTPPPQAAPTPADSADTANPAAAAAIAYARGQLGHPYVWGGNGPGGFDCSGLIQQAYRSAGIALPRTADSQYRAGPRLAEGDSLMPGDLVFYGNPAATGGITHVALVVGDGQVIHAPTQGDVVKLAPLPTRGYAGATRPANQTAHG